MNHKSNMIHLLAPHRLGQKRPALVIGPVMLTLVALAMVATMSFGAPVVKAVSPAIQDEYALLIDNPEMILISHYPAGSETAFLADNPEMILVSHYPAGSEAALLVANPELIVAHMYYGFNARTASGLQ